MNQLIEIFNKEVKDRSKRIIEGIATNENNTVTRELHGLKGTAKMMGFEDIGNVIHELEDMVKRNGLNPQTKKTIRNFLNNLPYAIKENNPEIIIEILSDNNNTYYNPMDETISLKMQEIYKIIGELTDILWEEDIRKIQKKINYAIERIYNNVLTPIKPIMESIEKEGIKIANQLNKKINFKIYQESVLVDKNLAENIMEILIHLIKNAIDHGIEPSNIRKEKGKKEEGNISINIIKETDHIKIIVEDDGKGIDIEELKKQFPDKKDVTPEQLIFEEGITTKKEATNISGRGMGLSDIRSIIRNRGGNIKVEFEKDKYTRFIVTLPYIMLTNLYYLFSIKKSIVGLNAKDVKKVKEKSSMIEVILSNGETLLANDFLGKTERHIYKLPAIFNTSPYSGWFLFGGRPCFIINPEKLKDTKEVL